MDIENLTFQNFIDILKAKKFDIGNANSSTTSCSTTAEIIWNALIQNRQAVVYGEMAIKNQIEQIMKSLDQNQGILYVSVGNIGTDHSLIFFRVNQDRFKLFQSWQSQYTFDEFMLRTRELYFTKQKIEWFLKCLSQTGQRQKEQKDEVIKIAGEILSGSYNFEFDDRTQNKLCDAVIKAVQAIK